MKVYIDLQKLAISKVVDGTSPEYTGDINSNVFEILFFNYDNTNWFPTMSQLAPNGRQAGDFEADSLGVGETHDYTEDGVNYQRFTFTMGSAWVLMKGRSNLFIWYNVLDGAVIKKCVGKLNVMLNESDDNYFISNPTFNPAVKDYMDGLASDIEDNLNDKVDAQNATIASLSQASPSVFDTAANIQLLQENKGVAVATDTGYIWYWDSTLTTPAYVSSGLQYNSLANYTKHSGNQLQDANGNNIYPDVNADSIPDYVTQVFRGILATNSDLNSILVSSQYMLLRGYTYSNLPLSIDSGYGWAMLETYVATGTNVVQTIMDASTYLQYRRTYNTGTGWSVWKFYYSLNHTQSALSSNIDNITSYGTYLCQSSTLGTFPETITGYAILKVDYATSIHCQQTLSYYEGNIYRRFIANGVCGAWVKIYDNNFPKDYIRSYVYNKKVLCNKVTNSTTAYYVGVDVGTGKKANVINCKYIWEKSTTAKTNSGVIALIINPNGCDKISQITNLSLHLQITATTLKVHILGNAYGTYYYQTLIDTTLTNTQSLNGSTEYDVTMATSGNKVYVYVNGVDSYNGTFVPDSNISSLSDVLGQYALFEHYCNGNMDNYCMPQFTKFLVRQDSDVLVWDDFKREDGQLSTTPQGTSYHLFTNSFNFG